ncbi:MAG: hypothetical protein U0517_04485 [Candidatus Andersenbacteria bacterium]
MTLLQQTLQALAGTPSQVATILSEGFSQVWFIGLPIVLFYILYWYWKEYQIGNFVEDITWVNLAIKVPPENEQSPKVMEEFFTAIHSIHTNPHFNDRFWKGKIQEWFSLEIFGRDGVTSFVVRAPAYFKDLVEAHLYAQFPDVEIVEVPDYTQDIPDDFKKAGWDMFGADMVLTNKDFYPIKTYPFFEHQLTKRIIDPISTMAEVFNKLKKGEQIWLQITIRPVMTSWSEKAREFAGQLMGQNAHVSNVALLDALGRVGDAVGTAAGIAAVEGGETGEETPAALLMPPGQRKVVEAIERKASKQAFEFKCRMWYLGNKAQGAFDKRRFNAMMGAFKQFNSYDMNGFKPNKRTFTKIDFFFQKFRIFQRQRKLLRGFKTRSWAIGTEPKIMTSEELASMFHIPDITVKAPRVPRTTAKKGGAPPNLPLVDLGDEQFEPNGSAS